MSVAEQLRRDEIELRRVQRSTGPDQPLVTVMRRHVMRWQQNGVVMPGVQVAIRPEDDDRLGENDTTFRAEVFGDELMMLRRVDALCLRATWSSGRNQGSGDQRPGQNSRERSFEEEHVLVPRREG